MVNTERPDPPMIADEREMLLGFLDFHRGTIAMKCDGLDDAELRQQSMPPSTLSLLGLVRHMAEIERTWFRRVINGEDIPLVWSDSFDFQAAYDGSSSTRAEAFDAWSSELSLSRQIMADVDLDKVVYVERWDENVSVRMIVLHMIHEYARHSGHADLLREGVDGVTGV